MKLTIKSPNFNEEWMNIRNLLREVKTSIEKKYLQTTKWARINTILTLYFLLSVVTFLCACLVPAVNTFAISLKVSFPIIFWTLGCTVLLGICVGGTVMTAYNYPNGISKKSYTQSYNSLSSTLEQLSVCKEFSDAYELWNKIAQLLLASDSPWSSAADNFISKINSLHYMECLTKVYELVSYTIIDNNMIAVTYAEENGDLYTSGLYPCDVKEDTKIEIAELSWDNGKLILTRPPYRKNK